MPRPSNRDLILDTAERLFAAEGVGRVSLRAICAEAGLNVAAANYYFGTKDGLVEAIVLRRMPSVMSRRIEMLDELSDQEGPPDVHAVVEALVLPLAELVDREGDSGRSYVHFVARLLVDRSPALTRIAAEQFPTGVERLVALLQGSVPAVPAAVLTFRVQLAFTTIFHAVADMADRGGAAALVDFVAGGLGAPVSSAEPTRRAG